MTSLHLRQTRCERRMSAMQSSCARMAARSSYVSKTQSIAGLSSRGVGCICHGFLATVAGEYGQDLVTHRERSVLAAGSVHGH